MRIRTAALTDLAALTAIERACFPPAEAATEAEFAARLSVYPNHFWLMEEDGTVTSFVNGLVSDEPIRPHAKLSKAVKVADTSDQGEAESKALSPVAVTLGEDTKPFDKTDGMFNKDTFS